MASRFRFRSTNTEGDRRIKAGGGMIQTLERLPEEIQDWVVDNMPPGSTLQDFIRAVITDAYYDDQEAREDRDNARDD